MFTFTTSQKNFQSKSTSTWKFHIFNKTFFFFVGDADGGDGDADGGDGVNASITPK